MCFPVLDETLHWSASLKRTPDTDDFAQLSVIILHSNNQNDALKIMPLQEIAFFYKAILLISEE